MPPAPVPPAYPAADLAHPCAVAAAAGPAAAAAAAAAVVVVVVVVVPDQLELALAWTLTESPVLLSCLAYPLCLTALAFQACPAALQSPVAACRASPVDWAPPVQDLPAHQLGW